ncbi:MAG: hypothetical protein M3P94_01755 [Chloroflexota bacterium]|nr:hypothetical protein [Chloroflexia bacterium]MDQ3167355.1 hypothetical protein [Chloroflexota bacterium]MDQ3512156.1 hypothetical protein [Chloroflexota bacterium]
MTEATPGPPYNDEERDDAPVADESVVSETVGTGSFFAVGCVVAAVAVVVIAIIVALFFR